MPIREYFINRTNQNVTDYNFYVVNDHDLYMFYFY